MGDKRKEAKLVGFDRSVKVEFHGANVTWDAGLLAVRELDGALGLTERVAYLLLVARTGLNTRHTLLAQLRQSVYSRAAGYEDSNDAGQLCRDPSIRQVVGERAKEHTAASTSQMGRFDTEAPTQRENLRVFMDFSGTWIDRVSRRKPMKKLNPLSAKKGANDRQGVDITFNNVILQLGRVVWPVLAAPTGKCR